MDVAKARDLDNLESDVAAGGFASIKGGTPGKTKSRPNGRDFGASIASKKELGRAPLAVAVLVFFVLDLTLASLFGLLLTRLAALLALFVLAGLARLAGLTTLLTLPVLTTLTALLTLLFHIVCHELLLGRARVFPRSAYLSLSKLSCRRRLQGWERHSYARDTTRGA